MKIKILNLLALVLLASCINNDIPYPHIKGEVLEFEVEGQIESSINPETGIITVLMSEDVDIRTAKITKLIVEDPDKNAIISIDPSKPIDLTSTVDFKVTIYRDWNWKIVTTQPIERKIIAKNQVGAAQIDLNAKTAHFEVAEANGVGSIELREVKLGPPSAKYTPDPMTITDFSNPVSIKVEYWDKTENWTITADNTTEIVQTLDPTEVWGGFAIVNGSIIEGTKSLPTFQYREKGDQAVAWSTITAEVIDGTSITARITKLTGETTYEYRAELGKEFGETKEFTTEATPLIPNMSFEDWTMGADNKTWFPNSTAAYTFWSSGNAGVTAAIAGKKDSNVFPTDDSKSGKAACLESIRTLVGVGAGSLFVGSFKLNAAQPPKSAKFSQNYTGRPTKLKIWYKYQPKTIDSAPTIHKDSLGKMDKCRIAIFLGDWTGEKLSSDLANNGNSSGVIAFAEFVSDKEVNEYTQVTLDIKYNSNNQIPTKIIILSSSSMYGDLFVGGIGSTLYLDEFEFSFD